MKPFSKLRALRYFSIVAFQLFSIFPLAAILDGNNNGMSDLWEKQHNSGSLFPNSFLPTADPDQDGWDNATEAVAGTDPLEPNPPDGIVVTQLEPTQTQGTYILTWPTIIGKRYRLQASYDLDTWSSIGNSHFPTETSLSIGINAVQPDTTVPPKIFWRVIVGDVDTDGDRLTNVEEIALGTNLENRDSDSDGLSDFEEIQIGTDPNDHDSDDDGIDDAIENVMGSNSNSVESRPPTQYKVVRNLNYYCSKDEDDEISGIISISNADPEEPNITTEITAFKTMQELRAELSGTSGYPSEPDDSELDYSNFFGEAATTTLEGENQYANITQMRLWTKLNRVAENTCKFHYLHRNYQLLNGVENLEYIPKENIIQQGESLSDPLDVLTESVVIPNGDGYNLTNSRMISVEILSDLNNDGLINEKDSVLRDNAKDNPESEEVVDKGTEYLFENDSLSNGQGDKEDIGAPVASPYISDDDAEPLIVRLDIEEGEVWLDHPAIEYMTFYKTKACLPGDIISLKKDARFVVEATNRLPALIYMRVDGDINFPIENPEYAGDLVLMFREKIDDDQRVDDLYGEETVAMKLSLRVVGDFGAKHFFHAAKDYIYENNSNLFIKQKTYYPATAVNEAGKVFITVMCQELLQIRALDSYNLPTKLHRLDSVTGAYGAATVIINGNMTFDEQDIGLNRILTRRCHGRLVSGGSLNTLTSSDNDDENTPAPNLFGVKHPLRGSPLAGADGKYIAEQKDGSYIFAKGRVPVNPPPAEALGGLSTNYFVQNPEQMVGIAPVGDNAQMLFTVTNTLTTSGITLKIAEDAKKSGVEALPGGDTHELKIFKLDGGTSLALAYKNPEGGFNVPIRGSKHTGRYFNDYCIHTYLLFKTTLPR